MVLSKLSAEAPDTRFIPNQIEPWGLCHFLIKCARDCSWVSHLLGPREATWMCGEGWRWERLPGGGGGRAGWGEGWEGWRMGEAGRQSSPAFSPLAVPVPLLPFAT